MELKIYQPSEDSYFLQESLKDYLINLINKNKKKISCNKSNRSFSNQQKFFISGEASYINNIFNIKILDMGTGSGIQALTCKSLGFNNITAADINKQAVARLKKQKIKAIQSNLFSKINKKERFNLIIFNPPYLPENKYDKEPDTTAGKQGYEIIIRFLKQAKQHLEEPGTILLLFSSLSRPSAIKKQAKNLNYNLKLLNKKRLFFEEIYIYEITPSF